MLQLRNTTPKRYGFGGKASLMKDLEVRRQVLEIADQYDALAADIDRRGDTPI
jgi:hypothetical protein